jgi:hypothetical protein
MRYRVVRVAPDISRVFFPPFFYYTKEFTDGVVGPVEIGDSRGIAEEKLRRAYPNTVPDPSCRDYPRTEEISGSNENACYTTPSRISRYPLMWLIGIDHGIVGYVKVTTLVPVDL